MYELPLKAGMAAGLYPERDEPFYSRTDEVCLSLLARARQRWKLRRNPLWQLVKSVERNSARLVTQTDGEIRERVTQLRMDLRQQGLSTQLVTESFAIIRETAGRSIGMRHYGVQLIGGWILLSGRIAEMETGEGKTLTATLAAGTAALAGIPVTVITVNDYLAQRDAEQMGPVYQALGLCVGVATGSSNDDERRAAYQCDIVYCTNKTLAFDYLRDRITLGGQTSPYRLQLERFYGHRSHVLKLFLRGLYFAIIDEADSVLVDEARTPLIISRESDNNTERDMVKQALELADQLEVGLDYELNESVRLVLLKDAGKAKLARLVAEWGGLWSGKRLREELVSQALTAQHFFIVDKHYLVRDGKVQIIDEYTGRLMPDRSWERGLHQMVEAKEGCEITPQKETLARISYQRFFRRYLRLAGMTGTARETAGELEAVYQLPVISVPTHRPAQRAYLPTRVFGSAEKKWQAVVARVAQLHQQQRPVLIGTRSVGASEHMSRLLTEAGITHEILNARQDEREAEIISLAGHAGRVTIATNMAGRGTDISLGEGVEDLGGLHVILTERHEARRIDRQLAGRCARQGEKGSVEELLSLDDELLERIRVPLLKRWLRRLLDAPSGAYQMIAERLMRRAQQRAEKIHSRMRRNLLKVDRQTDNLLAFSGRSE